MRKILVTGATGRVGREVVSELTKRDCAVRALTRAPQAARLPEAVAVFGGDLTDAASLDPCLEGVDTVFLVWTAPFDAAPAAVARIARHARHVVLLSSPHKTAHPFFQQPNPLRALQAGLERTLEDSGLRTTFVRPGMFAANALAWWGPQVRDGDVVRWPYTEAPTAPIHERDIAEAAVQALLGAVDRPEVVLTGPDSLTQREQIEILGRAIGRPLRCEEIAPDEFRRAFGAPPAVASMLLDAWAAALGQPAFVTATVAEVTGRPARTFGEWARDHAHELVRG